jgi:F0F1-type ATP synthase membrane subunit a
MILIENLAQFFLLFWLLILFIYISNVIPLSGFPSENSLSHPPTSCSPTHQFRLTTLAFPYAGAMNLHKTKGSPPIDAR